MLPAEATTYAVYNWKQEEVGIYIDTKRKFFQASIELLYNNASIYLNGWIVISLHKMNELNDNKYVGVQGVEMMKNIGCS